MTNRPKQIGTAAETAVARYLAANGWPHAERRTLRGNLDCGDITGTPGICWEIKGGHAAERASDGQVDAWLTETGVERVNAHADIGILVMKRKGIAGANAERWWAVMTAETYGQIIGRVVLVDGLKPRVVRLHLFAAVHFLRMAGYGQPLEDAA